LLFIEVNSGHSLEVLRNEGGAISGFECLLFIEVPHGLHPVTYHSTDILLQ